MAEIKSLKEQFEEQIGAKIIGKFEPVVLHDGGNWTDEGAATEEMEMRRDRLSEHGITETHMTAAEIYEKYGIKT